MTFDVSRKGLTTLKGIEFPPDNTILYCYGNQLTTLEGCPSNVTTFSCYGNQLTTLEGCPPNVTTLYCYGNPLVDQYKDKSLPEIHEINRIKALQKGISLLNNLIYTLKIQRCWRRWWYEELDSEGVSRFIRKSFIEFESCL